MVDLEPGQTNACSVFR